MKFASIGSQVVSWPSKSIRPALSKPNGFTLLEALVGMTIFAIAMSSLLSAYRNSIQSAQRVEVHASALILAQSLLTEATSTRKKPPVSRSGLTGNLSWTVIVRPATGDLAFTDSKRGLRLYQIFVKVRRRGRDALILQTLLLAGGRQ